MPNLYLCKCTIVHFYNYIDKQLIIFTFMGFFFVVYIIIYKSKLLISLENVQLAANNHCSSMLFASSICALVSLWPEIQKHWDSLRMVRTVQQELHATNMHSCFKSSWVEPLSSWILGGFFAVKNELICFNSGMVLS